ncbi:MAG: hypothetical protein OXN84_17585 [Albidovulum sp.]|nr:hypothetical protein [Albidovulum sp.]
MTITTAAGWCDGITLHLAGAFRNAPAAKAETGDRLLAQHATNLCR